MTNPATNFPPEGMTFQQAHEAFLEQPYKRTLGEPVSDLGPVGAFEILQQFSHRMVLLADTGATQKYSNGGGYYAYKDIDTFGTSLSSFMITETLDPSGLTHVFNPKTIDALKRRDENVYQAIQRNPEFFIKGFFQAIIDPLVYNKWVNRFSALYGSKEAGEVHAAANIETIERLMLGFQHLSQHKGSVLANLGKIFFDRFGS